MDTPAQRLIRAREAAGYPDRPAVIQETGWSPHTYKSHEAGYRGISPGAAKRYGRKFRVNPAWLLCLTNEGGPDPAQIRMPAYPPGRAAEMDQRKMQMALDAAEEILAEERISDEERRSRRVALQLVINRFLEAEERQGHQIDGGLIERICELVKEIIRGQSGT